ncbi:MAG: UMP kinase [Nanoarchaeota archaeon]|nr:UMP kinase [Nanoarchaeota archaeon]MBU0977498.1 UMP kinase [Nanoarchaeota archaeon]
MKKTIVLSLGGSLIVPEKMKANFLIKFVKTLRKHYKTHKFVVVCGGGVIARKYISALKAENRPHKELAEAGIRATRMNAQFIMQMFTRKEANDSLPTTMKQVKSALAKNNVVICGALRFALNSTSDSTAAQLAHHLKTEFINLTNVHGLYDKDPKKHKNAKFIPLISWDKFLSMANKIKFEHGQNFILDQNAAKIIKKHKISTYLLGPKLNNLSKVLNGKKFKGTLIGGQDDNSL